MSNRKINSKRARAAVLFHSCKLLPNTYIIVKQHRQWHIKKEAHGVQRGILYNVRGCPYCLVDLKKTFKDTATTMVSKDSKDPKAKPPGFLEDSRGRKKNP